MSRLFIDIGEIGALKCVKRTPKTTTAGPGIFVDALGTKGTLQFCLFPVAYSRGVVRAELPDGRTGILTDVRLAAFLESFHVLRRHCPGSDIRFLTSIKKGETIELPDIKNAWLTLMKYPGSYIGGILEECEWVDENGNTVPEPEDFRTICAMDEIYLARKRLRHGGDDCPPEHEVMLDVLGRIVKGGASDREFDLMMEWYVVTADAARTINLHINRWRDNKPNIQKIDRFYDFLNANLTKLESLCSRVEYARHLWQRKVEICSSRAHEWTTGVEQVEIYTRSRFGRMYPPPFDA